MSRNIFHICNFFLTRYKNVKDYNFIYVPIIGSITCGHLAYIISSEKTDVIRVSDKYTFTQSGHTNFMIVDTKGRHYNVNNSFWFWKWDSIEDWTNLKQDETIRVKYYGYRIPELGIFPNIIGHAKLQCV